jgi:hypothetical protein
MKIVNARRAAGSLVSMGCCAALGSAIAGTSGAATVPTAAAGWGT